MTIDTAMHHDYGQVVNQLHSLVTRSHLVNAIRGKLHQSIPGDTFEFRALVTREPDSGRWRVWVYLDRDTEFCSTTFATEEEANALCDQAVRVIQWEAGARNGYGYNAAGPPLTQ